MNVFEIPRSGEWGVRDGAHRNHGPDRHVPLPTPPSLYFLDLPGYGYARVSQTERARFAELVRHVLSRPKLTGVVWLLDIRHEPSTGDREMQDLLAGTKARVLAAVTKSDKLSRADRLAHATALREALGLDEDQIVVTSARTKDGMSDLRDAVLGLVAAG
jgi:GTP-binding protein